MNNVTKTYYYLTNRGFASEIIQLINAVSHALISRKPIYVISKTWNAAVSKGWLDYFNNSANLFILTEDTTPKIKLRNFKISKEFLLFIYFTETFKLKGTYSPKKGLTKYFKPIINTFILSITAVPLKVAGTE